MVVEQSATCFLQLQETMKFQLQETQDRYKVSVDELLKEQLLFQISDKIWLLWHNIKTTQLWKKLDF